MQHSSIRSYFFDSAWICRVAISAALCFPFTAPRLCLAQMETPSPTSSSAATPVSNPDETFAAAVKAYKGGDYESARTKLIALEKEFPQDPTLMLNLGVLAAKDKRWGSALGLWRKGLAAHPTNSSLGDAVDWARTKLPKSEIAREFDTWETIRSTLLVRASPPAVIAASAFMFLIGGWLFLRWLGLRRRALDENLAMPPLPIGGIAISTLFVFLFSVSIAMFVDRLDIRGTIVPAKIEVRSAPDGGATVLFELFEGMEVIVQDSRTIGDQIWRLLTYPGGLSGWVPDKAVMTTVDSSERAF